MAYPHYHTNQKDVQMAYPHYSDPVWRAPRCVFGDESAEVELGNYSDRLWQWDRPAAQKAGTAIKEQGMNTRTAQGCEAWLCHYHGRAVEIVYILLGVNLSNGYSYAFYGYNFVDTAQ